MSLFNDRKRIVLALPEEGYFDDISLTSFAGDILGIVTDGVELDSVENISEGGAVNISKHTIEQDDTTTNISDHIQKQPETLTLAGTLYETTVPIVGVVSLSSLFGEKTLTEKLELLAEWRDTGARLIFYGYGQEEIQSVAIKSINKTRTSQTGPNSVNLSISLQKVDVVSSERREITLQKKGRPQNSGKGETKTDSTVDSSTSQTTSTLKGLF